MIGVGAGAVFLLAAALGACTSMTVALYARRKQWELRHVTVGFATVCPLASVTRVWWAALDEKASRLVSVASSTISETVMPTSSSTSVKPASRWGRSAEVVISALGGVGEQGGLADGAAAVATPGDVDAHAAQVLGGVVVGDGGRARPGGADAGAFAAGNAGTLAHGEIEVERDLRAASLARAAVGSDDDTIAGSRDALSPLLLWFALRRLGRDGLARRVGHCLEVTDHAVRRLAALGRHPSRVPGGNVVLFDLPTDDVMRKWHLLNEDDRAHLVVMPHVTADHVDGLCTDLS